jgi:hypothetical protein
MIKAILGFPACPAGGLDCWPQPANIAAVTTRLENTIEISFNRVFILSERPFV